MDEQTPAEHQAWHIYTGKPENRGTHAMREKLGDPPEWRAFHKRDRDEERGRKYQSSGQEIELVNAAIYLRRPLLITGKPGSGKSSLAYAVAYELVLGRVLRWPITTHTTLLDGLYSYDAIGRLQDARMKEKGDPPPDIGQYITLGPLGTALLPSDLPRVLLIDEIDKSDIDLPNDLLNIFEEGDFEIPELSRLPDEQQVVHVRPHGSNKRNSDGASDSEQSTSKTTVPIERGIVRCHAFPLVIMTSNDEREFPPAFLRRCLRLHMDVPNEEKLKRIVEAHLGAEVANNASKLIEQFISKRDSEHGDLATDQLLNAIYLATRGIDPLKPGKQELLNALLKPLV